jgi:hypothetical protein
VRREVETARAQRKIDAAPKAKAAPRTKRGSGWLYYAGMAALVIGIGIGAIILLRHQFL